MRSRDAQNPPLHITGDEALPVVEVEALGGIVPAGSRVAGLDLGSKTIGIAVSDADWRFAHPRPVIRRSKFAKDYDALNRLASEDGIDAFVIGLPLNLDGSMSPRAQAARAFAANMLLRGDHTLAFWDERLSTAAAERALLEMDVSRRKRAERIDSAAAAFILQGVLDRLASTGA